MKASKVKKGYCIKLNLEDTYFTVKTIIKKYPLTKNGRSKHASRVRFTTECCRHVPEIDADHEVIISPSLRRMLGEPSNS